MNIDRTLFLALATSLSAAACAGNGEAGGGTSAVNADDLTASASGSTSCWAPQTESATGQSQAWYVEQIGFDPVASYPAAESFCIDMVWAAGVAPVGSVEFTAQGQLMDKCYAYAKSYVPFTTYESFYKLKQVRAAGPVRSEDLWGKMYEIDHAIAADQVVCITPAAKRLCANQTGNDCKIIASQLKPSGPNALRDCLKENAFGAFSCTESAGVTF